MARYTAADRAADRAYYAAKSGRKTRRKTRGKKTYGKIWTTRKGRRGRYVYINNRRVAFKSVRRRR